MILNLFFFLISIILAIFIYFVNLFSTGEKSEKNFELDSKFEGGANFVIYRVENTIKFLEHIKNFESHVKKTCIKFEDIEHTMEYRRTIDVNKASLIKIGQLKLFLSEYQFLSSITSFDTFAIKNSEENSEKHGGFIIYAGSAPSNKIYYLSRLFPTFRWILIDPNIHYIFISNGESQYNPKHRDLFYYFRLAPKISNAIESSRERGIKAPGLTQSSGEKQEVILNGRLAIRGNQRLGTFDEESASILNERKHLFYIIEDFCSDDIIEILSKVDGPKYFISDIRTDPSDAGVLKDCISQYNWVKILTPEKSMLKFRCPYVIPKELKLPYFKDDIPAGKFPYLKGEIFLQAFCGPTSTETRLHVEKSLEIELYDIDDYNNRLFYYNRVQRPYTFHDNPCANPLLGFDHCGDCALTYEILKDSNHVGEILEELLILIERSLFKKDSIHGYFFNSYKDFSNVKSMQRTLIMTYTIKSLFPDLLDMPLKNLKNEYYYLVDTLLSSYSLSKIEKTLELINIYYLFGKDSDISQSMEYYFDESIINSLLIERKSKDKSDYLSDKFSSISDEKFLEYLRNIMAKNNITEILEFVIDSSYSSTDFSPDLSSILKRVSFLEKDFLNIKTSPNSLLIFNAQCLSDCLWVPIFNKIKTKHIILLFDYSENNYFRYNALRTDFKIKNKEERHIYMATINV